MLKEYLLALPRGPPSGNKPGDKGHGSLLPCQKDLNNLFDHKEQAALVEDQLKHIFLESAHLVDLNCLESLRQTRRSGIFEDSHKVRIHLFGAEYFEDQL
jgi:hypothetical protein